MYFMNEENKEKEEIKENSEKDLKGEEEPSANKEVAADELEECQKLKDEYLAGWKRTQADFLNYKKEERERFCQLKDWVKEELILNLLPILDNIELAEEKIPEELKDNQWALGLLQIKNQILDFFKNQGIKKIKSIGEKFDPNFHEVMEEIEDKNSQPGTVIEEIQKGYLFNKKVIRPARVKIAK